MNIIYTISINQLAVVENGWDLDFTDGAILQCFHIFGSSPKTQKIVTNDGQFFWLSVKKIIAELPMSGITSEKQMRRRIAKLIACGLIEKCETDTTRDYYRFGANFEEVFAGEADKNVHGVEKSSTGRTKMSADMDKNVPNVGTKMSTEDNTNIYNINNKNYTKEDYTITPYNPPKGGIPPKAKREKGDKFYQLIDAYTPTIPEADWRSLVDEFLRYKVEIGHPLKVAKSIELFYRKLRKDANDNIATAKGFLEQAMAQGWQSYHPDAGKSFAQQKLEAQKAENAAREAQMVQDLERKRKEEEEFRKQLAEQQAERQRKIEEFRRRQAEEDAKEREKRRREAEALERFKNGETDELPF